MFQYLKNELWDGIPGKSTQLIPHIFSPTSQTWLPHSPSSLSSINTLDPVTVLSWNVDAGAPFPAERMSSILAHLQPLGPTLDLIQLQEVHPHALRQILSTTWVQNHFATTALELPVYSRKYGTVTLISKRRLGVVTRVFRMPFEKSVMGRDALVVDMAVGAGAVRFVNIHLESLMGYGVKAREAQMAECAGLVRGRGVLGGVMGGDVNAIAVEDGDLPGRFGFVDVWEGMKEEEKKRDNDGPLVGDKGEAEGNVGGVKGGICVVDDKEASGKGAGGGMETGEDLGLTWGFQPPGPFPPGRLDKILVAGIASGELTTFGKGLKLSKEDHVLANKAETQDSGRNAEGLWLSDHYALLATIKLNLKHSS